MAQPPPRYVVEVAWDANPLSNPDTWNWRNETDRLRDTATWSNGKQSPLNRSETCQGRFSFDDRDRHFDPNNTGSSVYPYNGRGKRPIRVRAVWDNPGGAANNAYLEGVRGDLQGQGAYYRLLESSGTVVNDTMGHAPGTSANCTLFQPSIVPFDAAYSFNGSSSQIAIPDAAGWLRFTDHMSVETWALPSSLTGDHTIWLTYTGAGFAYQLWTSGTTLIFRIFDAAGTAYTVQATGVLTVGQWAHIVGTYEKTDGLRLYVNGVQVATNLAAHVTIRNGSGGAWIGHDGGTARWNGRIDDVALTSYAFTAAQVADHFDLINKTTYPLYQGYFNRAKRVRNGRDATALVESSGLLGLLATSKLPASPLESEIRKAAPVGWWRLGETALNAPVADQVGANAGRIEGEPQLGQPCAPVTDQPGGMFFDADGQKRVTIPWPVAVNAFPFTVAGWFKADYQNTAYRTLFSAYWPDLFGDYAYYTLALLNYDGTDPPPTNLGGTLIMHAWDGGTLNQIDSFLNTWDNGQPHFVAARFLAGGGLELNVDGGRPTVGGFGGTVTFLRPDFFTLGNEMATDAGDFRSYASQADWQLYNRALSDAECAAIYAAGMTGWDGDTSGQRINRVLDKQGVAANLRSIDTGNTLLQGGLLSGGNPAEYLQQITKTEYGNLYETKAGILKFRQRLALLSSPYTTSQATFGNAGGSEVPFEKLQPVTGSERVVNRARIGRTGGTPVERFDQASIDANGETAVEATDLLFKSDNIAADYSTYLVTRFGQPLPEFERFTLAPSEGHDGMTLQALTRQIEDRVTIVDRPPGGGTVTQTAYLLGEVWQLARGGAARVDWYLAKTDDTQYFTLNDNTKGKLNGGYPLAF